MFKNKLYITKLIFIENSEIKGKFRFFLIGIGQRNRKNELNFAVVNDDAPQEEIMEHLNRFILREDIAIILVTYEAAVKIKQFLLDYESFLPVILEIPSKYHPYDPAEDLIMEKLIDKYGESDERRQSMSK